jgi:hypothetical protein
VVAVLVSRGRGTHARSRLRWAAVVGVAVALAAGLLLAALAEPVVGALLGGG